VSKLTSNRSFAEILMVEIFTQAICLSGPQKIFASFDQTRKTNL